MRYQRSFGYLFASPDWAVNLLAGSACVLLPLVGWALLVGYLLDVIDALRQQPEEPYPGFDIDKIGHYLTRGAVPMLVQLGALLIPVMLLGITVLTVALSGGASAGPSPTVKLFASAMSILIPVVAVLTTLAAAPVTLFLAFGDDGAGGLGAFVSQFFRHVLHETLLTQVFVVATGLGLASFGALLCFIGAPPAVALVAFAQYQLLGQLHELYSQRRNSPVAESAPAAVAAPAGKA